MFVSANSVIIVKLIDPSNHVDLLLWSIFYFLYSISSVAVIQAKIFSSLVYNETSGTPALNSNCKGLLPWLKDDIETEVKVGNVLACFATSDGFQRQEMTMGLFQRLKAQAIFFLRLEWHTELQQFHHDVSELGKEDLVVLGVALHVLLELFVLDKSHIGGQHHQRLASHVLELLRAVPLFPSASCLFPVKRILLALRTFHFSPRSRR